VSNALTTLEDGAFSSLERLGALLLLHNRIVLPEYSKAFSGVYIDRLDLNSNEIASLNANSFVGLNCSCLALERNLLTTINPNAFEGVVALDSISFGYNSLDYVPSNSFAYLKSLKYVSLSHAGLTSLPTGLFTDLLDLHTLELTRNNLTMLQEGIFPNITLDTVYLKQNPLKCLPSDLKAKDLRTSHLLPLCQTV